MITACSTVFAGGDHAAPRCEGQLECYLGQIGETPIDSRKQIGQPSLSRTTHMGHGAWANARIEEWNSRGDREQSITHNMIPLPAYEYH